MSYCVPCGREDCAFCGTQVSWERLEELLKAEMDLAELRKFHKRTIETLRANYDELLRQVGGQDENK